MQHIVIEKPYEFVPPHRGSWWPSLVQRFRLIDRWLRKAQGIVDWECRHVERLKKSLADGHGIMLTPNHSRPCDPISMGLLAREAGCHVYAMASWHLFHQDWFTAFAIRKVGGFSVNREGIDRQAIHTSIEVLESAERPLIVFPEGAVTRTNDRLHALLDGIAFIARAAAKKRARSVPGGKVVIHPVALKYFIQTDLEQALDPLLTDIEHRLSWRPQRRLPLMDRITKVGQTLLALKEIEHIGSVQSDRFHRRLENLINHLLDPLEEEWLGKIQRTAVVPRVKALRMKMIPDMISGEITPEERARRWEQLADLYLAQQVNSYPPDYLETLPSVDRVLETVERFEEDLTDEVRVVGPMHLVIEVDEAIVVSPTRDRNAAEDSLMTKIEERLQSMLDRLALESPVLEET